MQFVLRARLPTSPVRCFRRVNHTKHSNGPAEIVLFCGRAGRSGITTSCGLPLSFVRSTEPTTGGCRRIVTLLHRRPLARQRLVRGTGLGAGRIEVVHSSLLSRNVIGRILCNEAGACRCRFSTGPLSAARFRLLHRTGLHSLSTVINCICAARPEVRCLYQFLSDSRAVRFAGYSGAAVTGRAIATGRRAVDGLSTFHRTRFPRLPLTGNAVTQNAK